MGGSERGRLGGGGLQPRPSLPLPPCPSPGCPSPRFLTCGPHLPCHPFLPSRSIPNRSPTPPLTPFFCPRGPPLPAPPPTSPTSPRCPTTPTWPKRATPLASAMATWTACCGRQARLTTWMCCEHTSTGPADQRPSTRRPYEQCEATLTTRWLKVAI